VTTQLRLVEAPARIPAARTARRASVERADAGTATRRAKPAKGVKAAKTSTAGTARRAVNWGDWQLDARTRRVGRAGVAAARQVLNEARAAEELSQAS
jgi:hypothetical protein